MTKQNAIVNFVMVSFAFASSVAHVSFCLSFGRNGGQ